jgi:hypothetical protein
MCRAAAAGLIAGLLAGAACAAEPESAPGAKATAHATLSEEILPFSGLPGRIELRRQNSERGTPEESTRTTLRFERYLTGTVARLRLDLPFPDEKTSFEGDPFQPRPGDIKLRADYRSFGTGETRMSIDTELTFPTANPASLGTGKYQLGVALHSIPHAPDFVLASGRHQVRFEWSVRQTASFAGDPERKDINNTKPELALRDTIGGRHWLKLTLKPTIDWIQDGRTGAVLELEGGWNASREWRFSIMGGVGLWGVGVPGIYTRRLELVGGRAF